MLFWKKLFFFNLDHICIIGQKVMPNNTSRKKDNLIITNSKRMELKMTNGYVGWLLNEIDRNHLLMVYPPKYDRVIAHHCTLVFGVNSDVELPVETEAFVVGRVDDGNGLEALIVSIGNTTNRPTGGTYHITWSLAEGRRPSQSNDVIDMIGWTTVKPIIDVKIIPTFFPFKATVYL